MGIIYYYVFGILGLIGILGSPIVYSILYYKKNYDRDAITTAIFAFGLLSALLCGLVSLNIF